MFLRKLLFPFSILYWSIVFIRNRMFDYGFLKSEEFPIPVICIGNLSTGGTGKTPHTEYLIRLLSQEFTVAVLSRGYGRKTKGYSRANINSVSAEIGDEPSQIKQKYPDTEVIVCEKRADGIKRMLKEIQGLDVILLDDAFQHRYVKPGLSILLTDFSKPFYRDLPLPAGSLRDNYRESKRADIIIITKIPFDFPQRKTDEIKNRLKLKPHQNLWFSGIKYTEPLPVNNTFPQLTLGKIKNEQYAVLLITGIANPQPIADYLSGVTKKLIVKSFPDHHNFSDSDICAIQNKFNTFSSDKNKIIITTEKDIMRLNGFPLINNLPLYYIPIETQILYNQQHLLNEKIISYVKKDKRNRSIHEK